MEINPPVPGASQCKNCGAETQAKFCHVCGQKSDIHRLTLGHIVHEIPHAIFHVDKGFGATLWHLLCRPGKTINGYLDGQRVRYTNPLTLLLIVTGITAFLYSQYPFDYAVATTATMPPEIAVKYKTFALLYYRYQSVLLLFYLPVLAIITKLLFWRSGRAFGEHLIIAAYLMSLINCSSLVLFPVSVVAQTQGYYAQSGWFALAVMILIHLRTWYQVFKPVSGTISVGLRVIAGLVVFYTLSFLLPPVFFWMVYLPLSEAG